MRIETVLCQTITSTDLRDINGVKQYIAQMNYPMNVFSEEYRKARELELELLRYVAILELIEKYEAYIKNQTTELHYFRDSEDTVIFIFIQFYEKKKNKRKEFEKELKLIKEKSKRKLRNSKK